MRGTMAELLLRPLQRALVYLWYTQGRIMSRIPGMSTFTDMVVDPRRPNWPQRRIVTMQNTTWRHRGALRRWRERAMRHAWTQRVHGWDMQDSEDYGSVLPIQLYNAE